MALLDDVADGLAREAIALAEELDDETLVEKVGKLIGTTSPTVEEAFRTAARIRMAELRAQRLMADMRGKAKKA